MSFNYANLLIVFAKAPIEGQVKTRLMPSFSAHEANLIHQQLLEFTIRQILPTAQTEDAVVNHLILINQAIRRATPASVNVECSVTSQVAADLSVPFGTA